MTKATHEQQNALHLYFRWLAEALAEKHYDFRELKIELQPTEHLVKEYMWKPVQEALYSKKSTRTLEITEVSGVYDHLNRALSERFGVSVPFPNKEDLAREKADKDFHNAKT